MLTKFAINNYRGFDSRVEWNLSSPSNYAFNKFAVHDGVVKNGIIYGPNGSGKTNFSLALFDIVNHLTQKFKKADYYSNFVYAGRPDSLVEFEYSFRFGCQNLQYNYAKAKDGKLINESLWVDGEMIFDHHGQELEINAAIFPIEPAFKANLVENTNNVSIVNVLLTSFPLKADSFLIRLRDFVNGMLWFRSLDIREFMGLETNVYILDEYIIRKRLANDFSAFLRAVSGQEFVFAEHGPNEKVLLCDYKGQKVSFDEIASTGTRSLMLLYFWLQKMNEATFVFIDEFDAFYHFELSYEVCKRLFALPCQAFTTSHNTYLMTNELLRPDCNFILNKNVIKPLNLCTGKELRFGHNIEKLYRGGAFAI